MNAKDLLDSVTGLSEAQAVAATEAEIDGSALVAGVEIARATVSDEAKLRKLWKQRNGGGATPLLLVADDPDTAGTLRVLGPSKPDEQIFAVGAESLDQLIRKIAPLSRLQATRQIGRELRNLDQTDVAGMRVHGLGTTHLFAHRLRDKPAWQGLLDAAAQVTKTEWEDVFRELGYEIKKLPQAGYLATFEQQPVCVVHPKPSAADFSRLDERGRPPEGMLVNDCIANGAPYGLLTAGSAMRLFVASPGQGSAVSRYLELDAAAMQGDDRALLGLLAPEFLGRGEFDNLLRDAQDFGAELKERVDRALRQEVLPVLGRELGKWAASNGQDLADDDVRQQIEDAALTFVFRLLFLLYAESSGYLPMNVPAYEKNSLTKLMEEAHDQSATLDKTATSFSSRIATLVQAMRTGNTAWRVPGYNGELFSASGFAGADLLEQAQIPDAALGPALVALGRDDDGVGVDFSSLEVGHLGHIYEGLLSLRLSLADRRYRYDAKRDRYVEYSAGATGKAEAAPTADVAAGDLLWITNEGGRKSGGVYYTPELLVRHLVRRGVLPAFERHLETVGKLTASDPAAAARKLLDFKVLDPACGSAHFLVVVVDELADATAKFLADTPVAPLREQLDRLQQAATPVTGSIVEDAALLRRLILKHCVFGVDISPMGAEIAKLSLWLSSFVPGLSLLYLGHNVQVGNSLIGVSRPEMVRAADQKNGKNANPDEATLAMFDDELLVAMREGAAAGARLADLEDRTPEEYEKSVEAAEETRAAVRQARRYFNLWCAEPLGLDGARKEFYKTRDAVLAGEESELVEQAAGYADEFGFLHWPLAFPEVFTRDGGNNGFDAVVGNPPWAEVTVEELAFYARYDPGLRALSEADRKQRLEALVKRRPELTERLVAQQKSLATMRSFLGQAGGYEKSSGDTDVYKLFCQRYRDVLRDDGRLAVVLPRSAFVAQGSRPFRGWLFEQARVERIDFLLNKGQWAFAMEPRYTVALVIAQRSAPVDTIHLAGVASSQAAFEEQAAGDGQSLGISALGSGLEVPLVPSQDCADLLAKMRALGGPFALGAGARWTCFPVGELHETNDRKLWQDVSKGWELWKGESFDQYDPRGTETRLCEIEAGLEKTAKKNPGKDSVAATNSTKVQRVKAVADGLGKARVAFRDVTRATDSRTAIACLVPPETFLVNSAPYLTFIEGEKAVRESACLGLMNSLVFDWQARRFVEIHLNFYVLENLQVPPFTNTQFTSIVEAAARLSCVDDRFAEFAAQVGVECGPLDVKERTRLRIEIEAQVAQAWSITPGELEVIFSDFTENAVTPEYRQALRDRLKELSQ